ncbi:MULTISPECIES: aminoacyl-tRNA hydrolase [Salimicrobium]|uniref:Peptidyl-tRNA hydrolase n=3 Tax=Salimicrobium TaxID=351195 RepID=K2H538_9BACI|nr:MULTISPECIES: aminoacyl-tRNA hydrolase [Salimicrobium]AKG03262.1 aminoacyl-tRNA hydrolase [Salimicrobium jeotgali]EKE30990.1 peptidyl-tRNA hydrolase [Salimicrobium jeotgali]MBM7697499.1 PTH1 family peptidyl-tRNA hydrolase [Salimicrobium jeotgali]PBB04910.1 aminoacyl-tRNA hydrolase [Salimicrobium humidisoli]SDY36099.1 peptidyl-tRNA hydrolase, PTH1 family [Salimicrobium album]
MKCIVGLGNPGKKYEATRHNAGFQVIDELAKRNNWTVEKKKFNSLFTTEHVRGEKIILLKPQTYMNLSGGAVRSFMDYFGLGEEDLLVIYDDLDLLPGKIRLRQKGGHGGHNGIRDIIDQLGTKEFKRLRVGIGKPKSDSVINHVLDTFSKEEKKYMEDSIDRSVEACEAWMERSFDEVMNEYNK